MSHAKAPPTCPVCGNPAEEIPTRYGPRFSCCGLHSWDHKPLASPETHRARSFAHLTFDTLWKGPTSVMQRGKAYKLLAQELRMNPSDCHISMMNESDARRVPDAVKRIRRWLEMARAKSRPKRWMEAVAQLQAATEQLQNADADDRSDALGGIEAAAQDIRELQEEYQEWRENLPEGLDSSPVADKLDEIIGIETEPGWNLDDPDDDEYQEILNCAEELIDAAESADLPLGFGRD